MIDKKDQFHCKNSLDTESGVKTEPPGEVGVDGSSLDPDSAVERRREATTADVKQDMDIGPIVLQPPDVYYTWRSCKSEPVEETPTHISLDMESAVRNKPPDVGMDVGSLDPALKVESNLEATTADVTQELDIGPIVLQPPDVHYTWRPYKSEPLVEFSAVNAVAVMSRRNSGRQESASVSTTSQHVDTLSVCENDGPYRSIAGKEKLKLKNKFQNHVLTTHTEKTQYHNDFKRGTLSHMRDAVHCCDTCKKRFTDKGTLKRHLFIHTGEWPHSCSVCNKTFAEKRNLNKHMKRYGITTL